MGAFADAHACSGSSTMRILQHIASVAYVIALPVLLVTTNVRIAAGDVWFYERGFREHDAAATTGIALPELDRSAREIIAYFEDDATMLRIVVDNGGEEISLFNQQETEHMRDVKALLRLVFRLHEIALAVVLSCIAARYLWAYERPLRQLALESLAGLALGLAVVGTIGAFAATGFDSAWDRFHHIAFSNDLWRLDPTTARLIQMFPEAYWEEMTFLVGIATVAQGSLIAIAALLGLLLSRKRPENAAI